MQVAIVIAILRNFIDTFNRQSLLTEQWQCYHYVYYKALVDKNMTFTGNTISVTGKEGED